MPTLKKTGEPRIFRVEVNVIMFVFARTEEEAKVEIEENIQREKANLKMKIREARETEGRGRLLHGYVEPVLSSSRYNQGITLNKTVNDYKNRL